MRKPIKPLPTDCCGSGCSRCIYEVYQEHLTKYKKWKKEQENSTESESE